MSFEIVETSRFRGQPVELYLFRHGSKPNAFYAYTNAEQVVSHEGIDYRPIPIERDGVKSNGTLDKSMLNIRMPKTVELPELFRIYPPSQVVTCVIRQGHFLDDDNATSEFLVVFSGRVLNVTRNVGEAVVGCEPNQTSMRRTGLRQHYQYGCPHALYGPRCRATKRRFPATVAQMDGTAITLTEGWNTSGKEEKNFQGGMVEWESTDNLEPRTILRVLAANVVLLSGFLKDLKQGDTVNMILGCPHDLRGCESIHNNVVNYGGQPWIPFDNPFGKNPF